jgi:hypothetical protein
VGGGSFSLTIGTEERGGAVKMLPKKDLVVTQCATEWAQKFAILLTLLALQEKDAGSESMILYIIG